MSALWLVPAFLLGFFVGGVIFWRRGVDFGMAQINKLLQIPPGRWDLKDYSNRLKKDDE